MVKNFLEIIGMIVVSVGGAGAIIVAISSFLANKIAIHLENKYQLRIDKELETYKATLAQRSYVTKVQFDMELDVYRKLSKGIFSFLTVLYTTIEKEHYPEYEGVSPQEQVKKEEQTYKNMVDRAATLQELLYENAAFMPKVIYEKYEELIELTTSQFWTYHARLRDYISGKISQEERVVAVDKDKFELIENKFSALNDELREHLRDTLIVE